MTAEDGLDHVLDYFDYLYPATGEHWQLKGVHLERLQIRLLRKLWHNRGNAVPHQHLMAAMHGDWPPENWAESNLLSVHIARIRPKVQPLGVSIKSAHGFGYVLIATDDLALTWVSA